MRIRSHPRLDDLRSGPAAFDVATIKLHKGMITFSADPSVRGRTVTSTASTLLDMITYAYGMRYEQISGGPAWVNADHYDLAAKAAGEGALTPAQSRQMVQALLADRFQLKVHRDTQGDHGTTGSTAFL